MFITTLLASLISFGFTVTIAPNDQDFNATKYFNEAEQTFYPCYYVKTEDFGTINACQSGKNTVEIMQVKK